MLADYEIAARADMRPITQIAASLGLKEDDLELYGRYKAKISEAAVRRVSGRGAGRLVLVTAINPTPAGEGKTTTTVGLGQAMALIGKRAVIALREPSMGPVFGIKGGAAGGGYSQVVPMEDINLHFTGDMHAITAANNLLCALLDNHMAQGNALGIDPRRVLMRRVLDMNDRSLRGAVIGLGGRFNGIPREESFMITVASEVMAILCLAGDLGDLKRRLASILVARRYDGSPVFARDLKAEGAMAALLRDALKPNLVQTLEGTPCLMHGGPFANIAHGCNSVRATRLALGLADYCITEAGFGADLGAEKFFDIKCRMAGLAPSAAVLVCTVRALKYNGGVAKDTLAKENIEAVRAGLCNLAAHADNMAKFGVPCVVALNRFSTDSEGEIAAVREYCDGRGAPFVICEAFEKGGAGAEELARAVCVAADKGGSFSPLYPDDMPVKDKVITIAREIYGASDVVFERRALTALREIDEMGCGSLPVCMAKTQYSLSDDPGKLGRPSGFSVTVTDMRISLGAGFVVAYTGDIMTMPGLSKTPAAEGIDVTDDGSVTGLF